MKLLRPLAVLTIAVATMLLLASCLSLRGDIALDRQAHASGKVTVEITKQIAGFAGITSADQLRDQMTKDAVTNTKVTETDTSYKISGSVVEKLNDPNGILAEVVDNPPAEPTASRDIGGRQVHFRFQFGDQTNTTDLSEDPFGLSDMNVGSIDLTIHFPGKVTAVTPGYGWEKLDDHTFRIRTQLTPAMMGVPFEAYSNIDPPKPIIQRAWPAGIGAVLLVLAGVGGWLWRRRRPPTPTIPPPTEPSEPAEPKVNA